MRGEFSNLIADPTRRHLKPECYFAEFERVFVLDLGPGGHFEDREVRRLYMTPHESNGFNPIGDSHLIYALIAEPREKTTGFQEVSWDGGTDDGTNENIAALEGLGPDDPIARKPYYQSSQFNRTLLSNAAFYRSLTSELGLADV